MASAEGEGNQEHERFVRRAKRDREDAQKEVKDLRTALNEAASDIHDLGRKLAYHERHRPPNYIEAELREEVRLSDHLRQQQAAEHKFFRNETHHLRVENKKLEWRIFFDAKKIEGLEAEIAELKNGPMSGSQCLSDAPLIVLALTSPNCSHH
jgi:predicted RNase H-like nuclease (RuvC/YqgF family)